MKEVILSHDSEAKIYSVPDNEAFKEISRPKHKTSDGFGITDSV